MSQPTQDQAKGQDLSVQLRTSVNSFSRDFYQAVSGSMPGVSIISSPLSAQIALAMLSLGAEKDTLNELHTSLYLPNRDFTKFAFKDAMEKLNALSKDGVTLAIANKVYIKQGPEFLLKDSYQSNVVEVFKSEIEPVNFSKNVESAAKINKWVEDKTNQKIKDLIKSNQLDNDTRMVLINAIYFKGAWLKKFEERNTHKQDFFTDKTNKVQVDMMHKTDKFRYAEIRDWNAKVLELPYKGGDMAMLIILPNEIDGLSDLEKKLADKSINTAEVIERHLSEVEVEVSLPKFRIETEMDLKQILPKVGISRIFDGRADLSGMLQNNEPLYVAHAIQKAFIEVNEEGAEAAAATAMMMARFCMPMPMEKPKFTADHPFMCHIIQKGLSSLPLFSGAVHSV